MGRGRTIGLVAAILVGVALVAIVLVDALATEDTTDAAEVGAEQPARPPLVNCKTRVQFIPARSHPGRIPRSQRRLSVSAGPAMFLGAKRWADGLPASRAGVQPLKVPISVKAGRRVTVRLSEESQRRAAIMVGRDRRPYSVGGSAVSLRPCRPSAKVANRRVGRRTPFAAGFKLREPTCVRLTVEVAGEPEPIERALALGASCSSLKL